MCFFDNLSKFDNKVALINGNKEITYLELTYEADIISEKANSRELVFCVVGNNIASVAGYIGFLRKRVVIVLINDLINMDLFNELYNKYKPQYIWCPCDFWCGNEELYKYDNYSLFKTDNYHENKINSEIALLLTTSGSTGSPKLVKQSYKNIDLNTESIVKYLEIYCDDRVITTLPMSYTYGLSLIQTHLYEGASIVLNNYTFMEKNFWSLVKNKRITTFAGVPYSYEMLNRLRFLSMDLPDIKYLTQAGGALGKELHYKFADGMLKQSKKFIVMYGATEATARMSYVPSEMSIKKSGSIGIPIPGGRFEIIDVDGSVINETSKSGELIYYGDNVTLGYAESYEDLEIGDERFGRLETGDIAYRDVDGYYYVVGRKIRFLKIYGNRINLAEVEYLLKQQGYEVACVGEDDHMRIYTTSVNLKEIHKSVVEKTGLNPIAFKIIQIENIPRNDAGKILYSELS